MEATMKQLFSRLGFLLICMLLPIYSYAADATDARDKVDDARDVIMEVMSNPDKGIPSDLLRKASAVAIFPGVVKAGFVFGGKYGRGVVLKHNKKHNTWSAVDGFGTFDSY